MKNKILKIFGAVLVAGTLAANVVAGTESSENLAGTQSAGTENPSAGTQSPENSAGTENARKIPIFPNEKLAIEVAEWEAASDDDAEAKINLAEYLAIRSSVPENKVRARELLEYWAARGNARAMFILARQARQIESTFRPYMELLRESAELGHVPAMFELALALRGMPEFQIWVEKAAEGGDFRAQMWLARELERGEKPFPQDLSKAFFWFKKAAETNDCEALFQTARCLENGVGVEKNLDEAQKYLRRAVTQGSLPAWQALQKYLVAGTPNPAISREIFGLTLGQKIAPEKEKSVFAPVLSGTSEFTFCSNVDWAGTRWQMFEVYRDDRNLRKIMLSRRTRSPDLALENEHYERVLADLTSKYGEFRRLPQPRERELFPRDSKRAIFFDGRTEISVTLMKKLGLSVSFWLRDENWEEHRGADFIVTTCD